MKKWEKSYKHWLESKGLDNELKLELEALVDPKDIEERFYKELEFGTAGLRGIMGVGTNRMNIYTVRKATQGLANYIAKFGTDMSKKGVVIAYDCRNKSSEFADEAALVLANNGIKAFVFNELRPTPELSFAVRELKAIAGIMITASHNPSEYNGYKVYWEDGGQIADDLAKDISAEIESVENVFEIKTKDKQEAIRNNLFEIIGDEIDKKYLEEVKSLSLNSQINSEIMDSLKIIYSPLHGTGNKLVRRGLAELGFKNVLVVPEQELPDGNFSTVKSPNPEEHAAFELAIRIGEEVNADILMATDPDADRVGVAVKNAEGKYSILTGNQLGALLLEYILSQKAQRGTLPKNGVMIKTIVTSELGRAIAESYGIEAIDVLTGFKYIGEKIKEFKETEEKTFLFGYEESYGFLIGDFVRDKDAVQACLMTAEMAAYYKHLGMSLYDALQNLFEKYGYYKEDLISITLNGIEGQARIKEMIGNLRKNPPLEIGATRVLYKEDYKESTIDNLETKERKRIELPKADCLRFILEAGAWFCVRPSGTEPKVKIYVGTRGKKFEEVEEKLALLKGQMKEYLSY